MDALIKDRYIEVSYLVVTGGSGSSRVYLDDIAVWLKDHPGHMIIGISDLGHVRQRETSN